MMVEAMNEEETLASKLNDFATANYSLLAVIESESSSERDLAVEKHIHYFDSDEHKVTCPTFPKDARWLNVKRPLSLQHDLTGKLVLLDFWTYCCVNCMHILPDLHEIEKRYSVDDGLVVIGVHSAKFTNEKVHDNVRNAVRRYNISHPILNDVNNELWNQLQISCWPTLLLLGPHGQLLFMLMGEGHLNMLLYLIQLTLDVYSDRGVISRTSLDMIAPDDSGNNRAVEDTTSDERDSSINLRDTDTLQLSYPGKVHACHINNMSSSDDDLPHLVISDTGNHRIIITTQRTVKHIVGSGEPGNADGDFHSCQFSSPQGCVFSGRDGCVYVADTGNHLIRKIDITNKSVDTLVQASGVPMSSPWDLALLPDEATILIAMAGSHQIWAAMVGEGEPSATYFPNADVGKCFNVAGSGAEENKNSTYATKCGFAQPSGLCCKWKICSEEGDDVTCTTPPHPPPCTVYIADSESSTIRKLTLPELHVKPVCGGTFDPKNLFAYGDEDGFGQAVKLQHPLDVTCDPRDEKIIYIADSYNHKIKLCHREVDSKGRDKYHCCTYVGTGRAGDSCGTGLDNVMFNEPGGLDYYDGKIYVADTNNNCIKCVDISQQIVTTLTFRMKSEERQIAIDSKLWNKRGLHMEGIDIVTSSLNTSTCHIVLHAKQGYKLSEEPPSLWHLVSDSSDDMLKRFTFNATSGIITALPHTVTLNIGKMSGGDDEDRSTVTCLLEVMLYVCHAEDGTCQMKAVVVPLHLHDQHSSHTQLNQQPPQLTTDITIS